MDDVFLPDVTDLFGSPVPRSRGKRGRPVHVPTADFRRIVELALACGHDEEAIAGMLRITPPTLRRHYFFELETRRSARLRLDMKNLAAIVAKVEEGKPAAMALLDKKLERMRQREIAAKHQSREPEATAPTLGKKAQAAAAAAEVKGRFAPPAAPRLLN